MFNTMKQCRWMYNRLLEEANTYKRPNMPDKGHLQSLIPKWKKEKPELAMVYSQCLTYEKDKLFQNISSLARTKKNAKKKRKPYSRKLRFKSRNRFRSFRYPDRGWKLLETDTKFHRLHLSKIGDIPILIDRDIIGDMKTVTIKYERSGRWFATITSRIDPNPAEKTEIRRVVGIDLGIPYFSTDTSELEVPNPMYLKKELKKLRREDRRLSRKKKGSKNYEKQKQKNGRAHMKVANRRRDFLHKLSRYYIDNYDLIVSEKLDIRSMKSKAYPKIRMGIMDCPWYAFNRMLSYKAEEAGKKHILVEPFFTSQICNKCGTDVPKELYQRKHECPNCGYYAGRDANASHNILKRGLKKVGLPRSELTPVDTRTSVMPFLAGHVLVEEAGSRKALDLSI